MFSILQYVQELSMRFKGQHEKNDGSHGANEQVPVNMPIYVWVHASPEKDAEDGRVMEMLHADVEINY